MQELNTENLVPGEGARQNPPFSSSDPNAGSDPLFDIGRWMSGANLGKLYTEQNLFTQIEAMVAAEDDVVAQVRQRIFPTLNDSSDAPKGVGVYSVAMEELTHVQSEKLFSGEVQATDGTMVVHDSLMLNIAQIGVCLTSYTNDSRTWVQHLIRRDVTHDPTLAQHLSAILEARQERGIAESDAGESLGARWARVIMAYAERAVLVYESRQYWLMGHGHPIPAELMSGTGDSRQTARILDVLSALIEHRKIVFVPSDPRDLKLQTLGNALHPYEYAIVDSVGLTLDRIGRLASEEAKMLRGFAAHFRGDLVRGVFRASPVARAQVFYTHRDFSHDAARIVMADSAMHRSRGFPHLISKADSICRSTFASANFHSAIRLAYLRAGYPFRYLSERETRMYRSSSDIEVPDVAGGA